MSQALPVLPVDCILPPLCADLARGGNAVLCAPPGAGKTTRVPLALLNQPWVQEKNIIMLEPRRLAARAAARFMAATLKEKPGERVGYRMRMESRAGPKTRILVVTEGVLTRMLQDDAALESVACVIFDEFHERSLHADTGLALCLDMQSALRPDLRLLAMSATLDSAPLATLLGNCPVHVSEGRAWPVDIRYAPPPPRERLEQHTAAVVRHALATEEGSVLVFLPGTAEIRRVEGLLMQQLPPNISVYPLYGELSPSLQDAALQPCSPPQRKVVLATSIAETSLTIEGVRVVVDAGLARSAVHDPARGMGQLITTRVSLASATQRAGRAGRTEAGVAFRLWHEGENAALRRFAKPEILEADLTPLLLQCVLWGVSSPESLPWLDPPPLSALKEAERVLSALGAFDDKTHKGSSNTLRLSEHGKGLAALPLHPRLAHMVLMGTRQEGLTPLSLCLAALLEQRLPSREGSDVEGLLHLMCQRREQIHEASQSAQSAQSAKSTQSAQSPWLRKAREHAEHLHRHFRTCLGKGGREEKELKESDKFFTSARSKIGHCGMLLAQAWPEWVAQQVGHGQFRLRCGRMACVLPEDPLATQSFLAVSAVDAGKATGRIFTAAALPFSEVEHLFATDIEAKDSVLWDSRSQAVQARRQKTLGALILEDKALNNAPAEYMIQAMLEGIAEAGLQALPWTDELRQWQGRVGYMYRLEGPPWPEVDDVSLLAKLDTWLAPFLAGITRKTQWKQIDLSAALSSLLPWELQNRLKKEMPTHIEAPSGSCLRLDYTAEEVVLAVKLQEMFGCAEGPTVGKGRITVTLHLTSPAGRPLQVTQDLASFWKGSYNAVRSEMRGRYPKHPWPEDPTTALPTRHTKAKLAKLQNK